MSPVTAAKHAGLDWKGMSSEQRSIVSKLTRTLNNHYQRRESALLLERMQKLPSEQAFPQEEIACAANRYESIGVLALPAPARHHHVMWTYLMIMGVQDHSAEQGFLTTAGRFVGRVEGLRIAMEAGQVETKHGNPDELYSEDMWPTPPEARGWSIHHIDD